ALGLQGAQVCIDTGIPIMIQSLNTVCCQAYVVTGWGVFLKKISTNDLGRMFAIASKIYKHIAVSGTVEELGYFHVVMSPRKSRVEGR
ncbi:MAG: hypothetical protein ACPGES_14005, partial [Coraliomargarita sp.]